MARQKNHFTKQEIEEINKGLSEGSLTFERMLGEGSFGAVVQALDKMTSKFYAVKMVIYVKDMETYRKRELDALTSREIKNQHIIRYFHSWASTVGDKQVLFIKMEWCFGSLSGLLARWPNVVKKRAFYKHVFPQILKGLDAIHSAGWVHRDLYPANILLANPPPEKIEDINIKIADFGLARQIEYPDQPLTLQPKLDNISRNVGNELYRAPEIKDKPTYGYKVDLYSAGIILYILSCHLENANKKVWKQEIEQLRDGGIEGRKNLCHKDDEMLVNLIRDLMKTEPDERPTARQALDRFKNLGNQTAEDIAPGLILKFRARKDGKKEYTRCRTDDLSMAGCQRAIEQELGIPQENQIILQENNREEGNQKEEKDGRQLMFTNVKCDEDVADMIKSAEEKGDRQICLCVENRQETITEATTETVSPMSID